jgi:hypothetical protein
MLITKPVSIGNDLALIMRTQVPTYSLLLLCVCLLLLSVSAHVCLCCVSVTCNWLARRGTECRWHCDAYLSWRPLKKEKTFFSEPDRLTRRLPKRRNSSSFRYINPVFVVRGGLSRWPMNHIFNDRIVWTTSLTTALSLCCTLCETKHSFRQLS